MVTATHWVQWHFSNTWLIYWMSGFQIPLMFQILIKVTSYLKLSAFLSINERNVFCMLSISAECKFAVSDSISMALTLDLFLSAFCIIAILSALKWFHRGKTTHLTSLYHCLKVLASNKGGCSTLLLLDFGENTDQHLSDACCPGLAVWAALVFTQVRRSIAEDIWFFSAHRWSSIQLLSLHQHDL